VRGPERLIFFPGRDDWGLDPANKLLLLLFLLLLVVLLATRPRPARNMPTTSARPARDPPATRLRSARPASRPQSAPNKSRKKISRFARLADNPPANPGPRPARNAPQNAPQTIVAKKNSRFARLASQPLPAAHLKSNFPQTKFFFVFVSATRLRLPGPRAAHNARKFVSRFARLADNPPAICFALRALQPMTRLQVGCDPLWTGVGKDFPASRNSLSSPKPPAVCRSPATFLRRTVTRFFFSRFARLAVGVVSAVLLL